MVNLTKLVEGCVDAHINSSCTKDASKQFRALIQHAYDIGVIDGKKDCEAKHPKSGNQKEADKGSSQKEGGQEAKGSRQGEGSQDGGSVSGRVTDAAAAAKAAADL